MHGRVVWIPRPRRRAGAGGRGRGGALHPVDGLSAGGGGTTAPPVSAAQRRRAPADLGVAAADVHRSAAPGARWWRDPDADRTAHARRAPWNDRARLSPGPRTGGAYGGGPRVDMGRSARRRPL